MEITPQMRSMFDKMFDLIIKKNLAQSFVYVHRDYMPRNLMLEEKDNPGVIDFKTLYTVRSAMTLPACAETPLSPGAKLRF